MGTAIALNVATMTFICGQFLTIEKELGHVHFVGTRKELRDDIIAMAILFVADFLVVAGINSDYAYTGLINAKNLLLGLSLVLFILFGALVVEISLLIFKIRNP